MTKKDKSTVDDIDSKSSEELLNGDGNDVELTIHQKLEVSVLQPMKNFLIKMKN